MEIPAWRYGNFAWRYGNSRDVFSVFCPQVINSPTESSMNPLNYRFDTRNNSLKHIPGHASEIKTDAEYIEASSTALADIEAIGKQIEAFTDDFDIRVAYNNLFNAYSILKVKVNKSNTLEETLNENSGTQKTE